MPRRQITNRTARSELLELVNVGPAIAGYFERVGITRTSQLAGRDAVEIYKQMCEADDRRHDPCLLDTVMSAVDQADGQPAQPWWKYTVKRKRLLEDQNR
ncbi:MAG: helix-hairpin-helix domain-containing protein [Candidatus Dormibacteraceae bacterium]